MYFKTHFAITGILYFAFQVIKEAQIEKWEWKKVNDQDTNEPAAIDKQDRK
jgi:hypothetical protein